MIALTGMIMIGVALMTPIAVQTPPSRAVRPVLGAPPLSPEEAARGNRWGARIAGRWAAGAQAPGGWAAYRKPYPGYALPAYWRRDGFSIPDHRYYGLPDPQAGTRWSRYYDDAVLTDDAGRVRDMRVRYDWDRYGGYDGG